MVTSIRYLLRVILAEGDEWPVVVRDLYRARAVCKTMTRIINREGEEPRVPIFFFKSVVQAVLLLISETWVFVFKSGHHDQIACSLLGGFSKPRTAATHSLDSGLCSMLI